jgi:hypothetical protein
MITIFSNRLQADATRQFQALALDGDDNDGDALGELVMGGLSDSPIGAVADPLLAAAKATRFSRGNAGEDCDLDQGGAVEMTIS